MQSQQSLRLCENCDKTFRGCRIFNGYLRIPNFCSQECYDEAVADQPEEGGVEF